MFNTLLKIARLMEKFNDSRSSTTKMKPMSIIISWLESLDAVPTLAHKLELPPEGGAPGPGPGS